MPDGDQPQRIVLTTGQFSDIIGNAVGNAIPDWVRAVGEDGRQLLANPRNAILTVVVGFVLNQFIFPIFNAISTAGEMLVDAVLFVFFGTDRILSPTGSYGLADVPLFAVSLVLDGVSPSVAWVFTTIGGVNEEIAHLAASAGLAGFPIAAVLAVFEVGLVLYVLWSLVEIIDIPFIELDGILKVAFYPYRLFLGLIR